MTQATRLLPYLRSHPGASSLDIIQDLHILNTTGRISDLRKQGYRVDCRRDDRGIDRYYLVESRVTTAEAVPLGLVG